ncbi:unnamed protein product [Sphagnum jensenii]|uniref:Uncharacterized protein n=1 Tax=Sphagnum jensenii TaxID=128206 RepID=A0ABP1ALN2_9BRYO
MRSSSGVVTLAVFLEADSTFFARFGQIRDDFRCRLTCIFELNMNAINHESCRRGAVAVIITAREAYNTAYILRDALENINPPLDDCNGCNESCCCNQLLDSLGCCNSSCAQLLEQLTPITTACPVTKIHTNSTNCNEVVDTVTIFFLPNPPVILIPL